ncbi:MAG: alpha/beta hydrolase [Caldilineaceae bacterium]|nr:alpha/beta hydrolase [Caldilineaceae bacterium]
MTNESIRKPQRLTRLIVMGLLLLALCFIGFLVWASRPAVAMPEAVLALQSDDTVAVTTEPWLVFTPLTPTATAGFILYPGALVDPRAYAPAAHAIAAAGYQVVIVPMPLNLAVFAPTRAQAVIAAYPTISHWTLGGHSLGGAMAAQFVADHPDAVEGLILWAAYPGEGSSLARRDDLAVTSIYGTLDGLATVAKIEASRSLLPPQSQFVPIEGGNHSQFGWYGEQRGDNPATITRAEQQAQLVAATIAALASK